MRGAVASIIALAVAGFLIACNQGPPRSVEPLAEDYLGANAEFRSEYLGRLALDDTTIRINAGGNAVTTADGTVWGADQHFSGGMAYANFNIADIANTTDDLLYLTERAASSDLGTFSYAIPVPQNGTYEVTLHFAEIWFGATGGAAGGAGQRVFSATTEGQERISNLDIYAEVGPMAATSKVFSVIVNDGVMNFSFVASANRPKVSAIEIRLLDATEPPPGPDPEPEPEPEAIRINAGGPTVTTGGLTWQADTLFSGGSAFGNFNINDIANTSDDILFLTERSSNVDLGSFSYLIPVPGPGTYQVRLYFAEIWWGATGGANGGPGSRVFDVDAEGVRILAEFDIFAEVGTMAATTKTFSVDVNDGVLDLAFAASVNRPKVSAIEVLAGGESDRPAVTGSSPANGEANVFRDTSVTTTLFLPNFGAGVDASTLDTATVRLVRSSDGAPVPGTVNTSGARDSIVFQPSDLLESTTAYTFRVTEGVRDESGAAFLPYEISFTTGSSTRLTTDPRVRFTKTMVYEGAPLATLTIGPDGKLYAAGLDGVLRRWQITANGELVAEQTFRGLEGRVVIGLAFDPNDDRTMYLWTSDNDPLHPMPAEDFTGSISRLRLRGLNFFESDLQTYIVGLPRSARDHLSNSIAFGPDGMLYLSQGSNTGLGAPDPVWYDRPERLLTAAILQIDPTITANLPIDVQTEPYGARPGTYDPFAANAPVRIYATGVRNAYDLLWHSNGRLYAPINGGNAGGKTPASPDGTVPALLNAFTQPDLFHLVEAGGYYGHPNALRGEYVLNGGNPTGFLVNGDEVLPVNTYDGYPIGTLPDPNYRRFLWNFGANASTNGVIEYRSATFDGLLRGRIMVVQFSAGKNVLALELGATGSDVVGVIEVMAGFTDPLDLIEDQRNGNIYVAELVGWGTGGRIQLLRPDDTVSTNSPPSVDAGQDQSIAFGGVAQLAGTASDDGLPNPPGTLVLSWERVIGPGTVTFSDAGSLAPSASFSEPGTYVLALSAFDGALTTTDQMTVEVHTSSVNLPPVVDAGPDMTFTLLTVSGSASDDGLPAPPASLTYAWSQKSGPASVTFGDPSALQTRVGFPVAGVYVLTLTVFDGELSSTDDVTITVD